MNDQVQEDRISLPEFHIQCAQLFPGVYIGAEENHKSNTLAETSGRRTTEKQGNLCCEPQVLSTTPNFLVDRIQWSHLQTDTTPRYIK